MVSTPGFFNLKLLQVLLLLLTTSFVTAQDASTSDADRQGLPATYNVGIEDLVRIRASTDEKTSTFVQWSGQTLAYKPGEAPSVVFNVKGMNVVRAKKLADGSYDLLAREFQLYLDPKTNEVLHTWYNPYIQQNVSVIHVQNNPTYQTLPAASSFTALSQPGGTYSFPFNIPLAYPNPLNPTNNPSSPFAPYQGQFQSRYAAIESFTFTFPYSELKDKRSKSLPSSQIYWTRTSPLLPWMKSPDTNTTLLFVATGSKVAGGWKALDPVVKNMIETKLIAYKSAPLARIMPGGGVSSWSFFTQPNVLQSYLNGTVFPLLDIAV